MQPPEVSEQAVRNLTEQVQQLELLLLTQRGQLQDCAQKLAMFETAACERLRVIEHGDALLRQQKDTIERVRREASGWQERAEALEAQLGTDGEQYAAERRRLEQARLEAGRGMRELAERERRLTAEILELRNEGLLHSMIRRIRRIFH